MLRRNRLADGSKHHRNDRRMALRLPASGNDGRRHLPNAHGL